MSAWHNVYCGNKKKTISDMHGLAKERGGKCLSKKYVNNRTKLKWQCKEGHDWEATPHSIQRGSWCPGCAGNRKRTINDMIAIASERGGKCLLKNYVNNRTKLRWQCKEGHVWEARPDHIKRGRWCPACSGKKRKTMSDMHSLAKKRGGKCLSKKYINNKTKLKWQCKEGHVWEATPDSIKRGSWCRRCSIRIRGDKLRGSIEEMQAIAEERGGKCLSRKYIVAHTKLRWQCKEGHVWWAAPKHIKKGSWCPECSSYRYEKICRIYMERVFKKTFPKVRNLEWLRNKAGSFLELDGYCEEIGIAFEHHGMYHYQIDRMYSKNKEELQKRRQADRYKESLCSKAGIELIVIPELESLTPVDKLLDVITIQCKNKNIILPENYKDIKLNLADVYISEFLEELQEIAIKRGGKCLSEYYISTHTKLKWQCKEGHVWEATPDNIKRGTWCPICAIRIRADKLRGTIEEMHAIAEKRGGRCLSKEYIDIDTKLKWQCKEGHIWEAIPYTIKIGHWCPNCASKINADKQRGSIKDMHVLAKERGGKCLSEYYISTHTKLKWQCKEGHVWEAIPSNIKKGIWCPVCGGTKKKTIEDMHGLARDRGGKCLSKDYVNNSTKLKWQCKEGHDWEAAPHNIKSGTWCPVCSRKKFHTVLKRS